MRLNIEERFFAMYHRCLKMAKIMGWNEFETIGHLVHLWHSSQSDLRCEGDADDLCSWARVYENEQLFVETLCHKSVNFCKPIEGTNQYLICGNEKHVEKLKKLKENSQRGVEVRRKNKKMRDNHLVNQKPTKSQPSESKKVNPTYNLQLTTYKTSEITKQRTTTVPCTATTVNSTALDYPTMKRDITDSSEIGGSGGKDPTSVPGNPNPEDAPNSVSPSASLAKVEKKSEKVKKSRKAPAKRQIKTWSADNPMANIFGYLNRLKPYRAIFDAPTDQAKIEEYMKIYELDLKLIEAAAFQFSVWYDGKEMKSPRGSFAGWLRREKQKAKSKSENTDKDTLYGKPRATMFIPDEYSPGDEILPFR